MTIAVMVAMRLTWASVSSCSTLCILKKTRREMWGSEQKFEAVVCRISGCSRVRFLLAGLGVLLVVAE